MREEPFLHEGEGVATGHPGGGPLLVTVGLEKVDKELGERVPSWLL